jgi:hypothetical protein
VGTSRNTVRPRVYSRPPTITKADSNEKVGFADFAPTLPTVRRICTNGVRIDDATCTPVSAMLKIESMGSILAVKLSE